MQVLENSSQKQLYTPSLERSDICHLPYSKGKRGKEKRNNNQS
jgi:hypothetical protein